MNKSMLSCCVLLIISFTMSAQVYYMQTKFDNIPYDILTNISKMGRNDSLILTKLEGEYFNAIYQVDNEKYNLSHKKTAFLTGSLGTTESNKKKYFEGDNSRFKERSVPLPSVLYIFDTIQREKSGGYDAAIVYYSKRVVPIRQVVKTLKKKK